MGDAIVVAHNKVRRLKPRVLVAQFGGAAGNLELNVMLPVTAVALLESIELLAAATTNFADRVTIQSFDWRTLVEVKKLAPEISTVCITQSTQNLDNARNPAWTAGLDLSDHHNVGAVARGYFVVVMVGHQYLRQLVASGLQNLKDLEPVERESASGDNFSLDRIFPE